MSDPLDDLLDSASEALRDGTAPGSESGKATQWAVIDGLRTRQRRKDWALASSIAFSILFVAPTVWAHVTGRLEALVAVVMNPAPVNAPVDSGPPSRRGRARGADTRVASPSPERVVETAPEEALVELAQVDSEQVDSAQVVAGPAHDETANESAANESAANESAANESAANESAVQNEDALRPRPRPRPRRHPAPAEDSEEPRVDAREREFFARAHRSHFGGGIPSQTLLRWDEYLAAYPAGSYVPEARYNRALTLVRLRDYRRARVVLELFARGEYGPGRRSQARELLELIATDPNASENDASENEPDEL